MKTFESLSPDKKERLLKLPVYVSFLAANEEMDAQERKEALELTHVKSYAAHPLVRNFYKEAEKVFSQNVEALDRQLPRDRQEREVAIGNELKKLREIINELDEQYASALNESIRSYNEYVSKAHRSFVESFLFPYPINGITD